MQHQHRLTRRRAQRHVMDFQFRHDFAGVKAEVFQHRVARLRLWIVGGPDAHGAGEQENAKDEMSAERLEAHGRILPNAGAQRGG